MTREKFSAAKRNLLGKHNLPEGFEMFSPISSEFFHMAMNFLQIPFKHLWAVKGSGDIGTLKAIHSKLDLKTVNPSVKDHYSADKEFFIAVVDAHLVELVCSHFQMEDVQGVPTKNGPQAEPTYAWAKAEFCKMILTNIGTFTHRAPSTFFALLYMCFISLIVLKYKVFHSFKK